MATSLTNVSSALTQSSSTAASGKRKTVLSQEDFLNLFVTQMRYQNPLEPMDNFQMATQMAQMTSAESLKSIYEAVEKLAASQASWSNFQASGLIGKKVEYQGNGITLEQGAVSEAYYQLASPGKALLQVYDGTGNLVWKSEAGFQRWDQTEIRMEWKEPAGGSASRWALFPTGFGGRRKRKPHIRHNPRRGHGERGFPGEWDLFPPGREKQGFHE